MKAKVFLRSSCIIAMSFVLLAGCSGGKNNQTVSQPAPSSSAPAETAAPQTTPAPQTTTAPTPETTAAPAPSAPAAAPVPSASGQITEEEAKNIAFDHAGVDPSTVTFIRTELEMDHGVLQYDVEFYSGQTEYDYDIDANTGAILSFDQDAEYYTAPAAPAASGGSISEAEALAIALQHANVDENSISRKKVKRDYDDGREVYEISFHVGQMEYEYDIDASTGAIMSFESDRD